MASPFTLPQNTSPFDYEGIHSTFRHPLSPVNESLSPSTFSWDMNVYPDDTSGYLDDTNGNTSCTSSTGSSNGVKRCKKRSVSTFISKLYGMVCDQRNHPLISWNADGTSFLVCNATRFAKEVLPEHFKHSNFSSFVRQLNMYGFHKVNKSLRGQRGSNENEIWEFSHDKFRYGCPDLLEEIKRKAMDSELLRRETGDIHASFAMLQLSHQKLLQQFGLLQENYGTLLEGFEELKKTQLQQQIMLRRLFESTAAPVVVTPPSSFCPPEINYLPPSPAPSHPRSRHSSLADPRPFVVDSNTLGVSLSS